MEVSQTAATTASMMPAMTQGKRRPVMARARAPSPVSPAANGPAALRRVGHSLRANVTRPVVAVKTAPSASTELAVIVTTVLNVSGGTGQTEGP
jgi:hypothetical protein